MDRGIINDLKDPEIPESIRSAIAQSALEKSRYRSENRIAILNTPFVAALAGLVTLAATSIFGQWDSSKNAELQAEASQRNFQYEILKEQLAEDGVDNIQRAATLLFLARSGVLNDLNVDELVEMAEQQKENPEQNILPTLSRNDRTDIGVFGCAYPPPIDILTEISDVLDKTGLYGRVRPRTTSGTLGVGEIETLRGKTLVIYDKGHPEEEEVSKILRALEDIPGLGQIDTAYNPGELSPWYLSILVCQ